MSNYVPFDIQTKIVESLPIKSLVRFQTVSKQWMSLIKSAEFIKDHLKIHKTKSPHHLLVEYELEDTDDYKYISIVDDTTFPHQKSSLTIPQTFSMLEHIYLLNSDNGVLCLSQYFYSTMMVVILWNPTIRKSVGINIPDVLETPPRTFISFGVCPNTSDIKLVKINYTSGDDDHSTVDWEVKVFTLSTRVWKSVSNIPLAFKSYNVTYGHVSIGGFIYWTASDPMRVGYRNTASLIVSFDLKNDEFGEVRLPDSLVNENNVFRVFKLLKFKESLGLIDHYSNDSGIPFCDVWILKEGVTKSFSKMFSMKMRHVPSNPYDSGIVGFNKNGKAVIETEIDGYLSVLEVYDPWGPYNGIGISGNCGSFKVESYTETLLLLNESNSIIQ